MKFLPILAMLVAIIAAAQASNVVVLSDSNFYDYIAENASKRILVKFYAPWCGHCKKLAPTFEELGDYATKEPQEDLVFAKVDCTVNKMVCKQYNVRGYPTLKFFNQEKFVEYNGGREFDAILSKTKELSTAAGTPVVFNPLPPQVQEIVNDLEEIWRLRRNALAVIVSVSALVGMVLSCLICRCGGGKKVTVDDKVKKD